MLERLRGIAARHGLPLDEEGWDAPADREGREKAAKRARAGAVSFGPFHLDPGPQGGTPDGIFAQTRTATANLARLVRAMQVARNLFRAHTQ